MYACNYTPTKFQHSINAGLWNSKVATISVDHNRKTENKTLAISLCRSACKIKLLTPNHGWDGKTMAAKEGKPKTRVNRLQDAPCLRFAQPFAVTHHRYARIVSMCSVATSLFV